MKKKKKKLTMKYIVSEIEIANMILEEMDKQEKLEPEVRKHVKNEYFQREIRPLIEVYKTK